MSRGKKFDDAVRYPTITRRQRLAAAWAGFLDGRKQLPYGEVSPDRLPPSCAVLHAHYSSALSRIEAAYRSDEHGFAPALEEGVQAGIVEPVGIDPGGVGTQARAANRLGQSRLRAIAEARMAADGLRTRHQQAMADYSCVRALAGEAMSVYTRHLYRWHPHGTDLSARNWGPPPLPLPQDRVGIRTDLELLLAELDQIR